MTESRLENLLANWKNFRSRLSQAAHSARQFLTLAFHALLLLLTACQGMHQDSAAPGKIDRSDYADAKKENAERLKGEGLEYQYTIFEMVWDVATFHETPGKWVREKLTDMRDENSADNRRKGTLRLSDMALERKGAAIVLYAENAGDPDYTVRAAALRALNRCRAKNFTNLFLAHLDPKNEPDQPAVRLEAAEALGNIPDPASIPALMNGMEHDESEDVRIACAEALRNFHTVEVARALTEMLHDPSFSVAWQSRQSLELLTGVDFLYDRRAWLVYIANQHDWG